MAQKKTENLKKNNSNTKKRKFKKNDKNEMERIEETETEMIRYADALSCECDKECFVS